ncbi:ferritin-like fold-containing protein [Pseudoclavibacter endophyticus]|uniref:ferritin-like fold-containing protein n=1 Tax=Pseudoclavibacter endophyticus TaxID=1778590 RepID=UPI0016629776|nr:ferritin-like fold-containing protein [Pseudoclavibacter endophyticus]
MTEELQLADLIPDVPGTGARIAYLQLLQFQELSSLVTDAPELTAKQELGRVAALSLQRHQAAIAALDEAGVAGTTHMRRTADELNEFAERVAGRDWDERILTCHLAASILRDFYAEVLEAHGEAAAPLRPTIVHEDVQAELHGIIAGRLRGNFVLADRLAMWGRRITGDSLLAGRRALGIPVGTPAESVREGADAVLDEINARLMAEHSRRMNALGLAA